MNNPRRGFTLLEVLVATAILSLMVVVLAGLASQAGNIWGSVNAQGQRRSTGRAMLQFIVRDLELAAVHVPYPSSTNAANLQFIANISTNAHNATCIPAEFLNPHAAFWQAPVANVKTKGDIAEIGYFVRWDTSEPNAPKAMLCRFLVEPGNTNFVIYNSASGAAANWLDPAILSAVAPATRNLSYKGWFAENVIALWIRCLDVDGNAITANASGTSLNNGYGFDSRQGYRYTNSASVLTTQRAPALPAAVDIALVTLDSNTARKITPAIQATIQALCATANAPANFGRGKSVTGSVASFMDQLPAQIKPGAQVFTTRAYLKNASK